MTSSFSAEMKVSTRLHVETIAAPPIPGSYVTLANISGSLASAMLSRSRT